MQDPYHTAASNNDMGVQQPPLIDSSHTLTPHLEIMPDQQPDVPQTAGVPLFTDDHTSLETLVALDPAVEEYIRLADEMSNFFTWDASEYPATSYTDVNEFYM